MVHRSPDVVDSNADDERGLMSDLSTRNMSNREALRYHLEQCEPTSTAEAHLKNALKAVLEEMERAAHLPPPLNRKF